MFKIFVIYMVACTIPTTLGIAPNVDVTGIMKMKIDDGQKSYNLNEKEKYFQAQSEDRQTGEGIFH